MKLNKKREVAQNKIINRLKNDVHHWNFWKFLFCHLQRLIFLSVFLSVEKPSLTYCSFLFC